MNEQNNQKKKRLDETVRSRIKGLGLDALFHQVDLASKDRPLVYQNRPGHPSADKPQNNISRFLIAAYQFILKQVALTENVIFGNKHSNIVGIFFDSNSIRAIHFRAVKGSYKVAGAHYAAVPDSVAGQPQKIREFTVGKLKEIFENLSIKNSVIINLIPRYKTIVKSVSLPTPNKDEIEKMIHFEAEHLLSFPLHQLEFDYHIVATESDSSQIILAAIKKDILEYNLTILSQAGITPDAIDLTSFALNNTLTNENNALVIGGDMVFTDITLTSQGDIKASRGIQWGTTTLTGNIAKSSNITIEAAEKLMADNGILNDAGSTSPVGHDISRLCFEWIEKLIEEVKNTVAQWPDYPIEKIILTGSCAEIKNIEKVFKEKFELPIQLAKVPYDSLENAPLNLLKKYPFRFHALIGLADRPNLSRHLTVNLVPSDIKEAHQKSEKNKFLAACLTFTGTVFLLCYLIPQLILSLRGAEIMLLDKKLTKLNPQVKIIEDQKSKIQSFEDYIASKQSSLEVLRELSLIVSSDVIINTYTFEKNNYVLLRGEASSNRSVVNLAKSVRESKFFADAVLKYTKSKNRLNEDVSFEILCQLK